MPRLFGFGTAALPCNIFRLRLTLRHPSLQILLERDSSSGGHNENIRSAWGGKLGLPSGTPTDLKSLMATADPPPTSDSPSLMSAVANGNSMQKTPVRVRTVDSSAMAASESSRESGSGRILEPEAHKRAVFADEIVPTNRHQLHVRPYAQVELNMKSGVSMPPDSESDVSRRGGGWWGTFAIQVQASEMEDCRKGQYETRMKSSALQDPVWPHVRQPQVGSGAGIMLAANATGAGPRPPQEHQEGTSSCPNGAFPHRAIPVTWLAFDFFQTLDWNEFGLRASSRMYPSIAPLLQPVKLYEHVHIAACRSLWSVEAAPSVLDQRDSWGGTNRFACSLHEAARQHNVSGRHKGRDPPQLAVAVLEHVRDRGVPPRDGGAAIFDPPDAASPASKDATTLYSPPLYSWPVLPRKYAPRTFGDRSCCLWWYSCTSRTWDVRVSAWPLEQYRKEEEMARKCEPRYADLYTTNVPTCPGGMTALYADWTVLTQVDKLQVLAICRPDCFLIGEREVARGRSRANKTPGRNCLPSSNGYSSFIFMKYASLIFKIRKSPQREGKDEDQTGMKAEKYI
ncbi:hypothetical protein C8R43DRAFT_958503 [Mycena crocata]|nr:hypothetical protein C8R43DRAFT_958503 [Mycena crocata]